MKLKNSAIHLYKLNAIRRKLISLFDAIQNEILFSNFGGFSRRCGETNSIIFHFKVEIEVNLKCFSIDIGCMCRSNELPSRYHDRQR